MILPNPQFWAGKTVLVTGHTGFKGAWLALWLEELGARLSGIALTPDTTPALFDQLGLEERMDSRIVDIRDHSALLAAVADVAPDVVLHLAAQPLVLRGYQQPVETWATNVMGTANLLDALHQLAKPCVVVSITTDKVYRNNEWDYGYREDDVLGGHDPYSASKSGSELVIDSWRKSFFAPEGKVRLASARAGNVIGGGDWSENRLIPDIVRALIAGQEIEVRAPLAVRPWQHVLDPLCGYLVLAEALATSNDPKFQEGFNFGPTATGEQPAKALVEACIKHWPGGWRDASQPGARHEAGRLALSVERAKARLNWEPVWGFDRSVAETMLWYRAANGALNDDVLAISRQTIDDFQVSAAR